MSEARYAGNFRFGLPSDGAGNTIAGYLQGRPRGKGCRSRLVTQPLKGGWQSMIRFQIIEQPGVNLYKRLVEAMRAGELRTFKATKRGRRIQHKNVSYPGWMNWSVADGVINCEVISPHKPGREWQFFSAFLGRLADRYADRIVAINIQFPGSVTEARRAVRPKRRR